MDTRDMGYVLAVQEHGGIGRAADALGISQPALSKAIQRVEATAGLPLFERSPSGMATTHAGAVFIARARRIQLEFDDAMKEMRGLRGGELGLLRVGSSPSVASDLIVKTCRQLLSERPVARLQLSRRFARDLLEMVANNQLDLAVVPLPPVDLGTFRVQRLFDDRLAVMADEDHPLQKKRNLRLDALVDQQWLLPGSQFAIRQQLESAFVSKGLPAPSLRVEVDFGGALTFDLIRGSRLLTLAGTDTAGITDGFRALDIREGELDLRRHVGVVTRAHGYVSPLADRLMVLLSTQSGTPATEASSQQRR
ncbi:LysR family transcriptional regulator [Hydrogenophaga sp.]|uniref:LysR family transcriptional regulator n=1 Tax=Hydrogenophaga sp. TaxID=1904254 RepID=UPI00286DA2D5|nr:LysR family transcriptional regulator [Hydrogenophaga sp.]